MERMDTQSLLSQIEANPFAILASFPHGNLHKNKNVKRKSRPKHRLLTGTPEYVLRWMENITTYCVFEVIGELIVINPAKSDEANGSQFAIRSQSGHTLNILLVDSSRVNVSQMEPGMVLRCVGKKFDAHTLKIFSVREATDNERYALIRMTYLSDQEFRKFHVDANPPDN